MRLSRFWRHVAMSPFKAARAFPAATLEAVQREVAAGEDRHSGEVCFVVEAELTTAQLWADVDSRARARELFAVQGVWNTEENNGVLVYVLLADRRVEIVADRGAALAVAESEWKAVCQRMESRFREGRYEEGAIEGVREVNALLARHFPPRGARRNELADRPVMM